MKTSEQTLMRRTLAIVATGLVLGSVWAATAAADMYSMRLNSPAGTPAPYNVTTVGGVTPAAYQNPTVAFSGNNFTLNWYGVRGVYAIQAQNATLSGPWTTIATVISSSYAGSYTGPKPDLTNSYLFRLALVNNYYAGSDQCSSCHGDKTGTYSKTAHAGAFTDSGALASYTTNCLTVGFGVPTGFVDASSTPTMQNVGCENCHGPAAWHKNSEHDLIRPVVSIDPAICGSCHQGSKHPYYEEYSGSLHAQVNDDIKYGGNSGAFYTNDITLTLKGIPWLSHGYYVSTNALTSVVSTNPATGIINSTNAITGYDRATSCGECHSGAMRLAMINDYEARQAGTTNALNLPTPNDAGAWGPTCAVCHDPHGAKQFYSGSLLQVVTNIVAGVTNKVTNSVPIYQTLQLRNPTWSSNFYTIPSLSDKRFDSGGNPYYLGSTFASLYNPNVNVCGQCHNTRGARWDGLAYGLLTNTVVGGPVTNLAYVDVYTSVTNTQVFTNTIPWVTNSYVYSYVSGRVATNVVSASVTNVVISVGVTTNVTGFSRAPHNSVQYNILVGILQPDYLNSTNGKTVFTTGTAPDNVRTNGVGIYATHSGITPRTSQMNSNQCATCHVPNYAVDANNTVSGHSFDMDTHNCLLCHGSVPTWAVTQASTTNSIRNLVVLLNQWALDKAPAILGATDYNKSKMNSWEFTAPGVLASVTNTGPATTNQLKLPANILQARFNTYMVRNDGSFGVHNPTFIPLLLNDAETKVLSQYPVAAFQAKSLIVTNGTKVVFTNLVSGLSSYSWNFGDGHTSTSANPTNTYSAGVGTYTVTFTGISGDGLTTETLVRSNYIAVASLPVASFTSDVTSGTRPFTVNFSGAGSGGVSYRWQIFTNATASYYISDTTTPSVTYGTDIAAGTWKVIYRASNAAGSTSVTNTIQVN